MRTTIGLVTLAFTGLALGSACDGGAGSASRESAAGTSGPVAPVRVPQAIDEAGPGGSEALVGELDPYSLPADFHAASGPLTPSTTTLPVDETYGGSAGWAFKITQEGSGNAGWFRITSQSSANRMALLATHTGQGIAARAINTGSGRALWAQIPDASNPFPALVATHVGSGEALEAISFGTGTAGSFEIRNSGSGAHALRAVTDGRGKGLLATTSGNSGDPDAVFAQVSGSQGRAGDFSIFNFANPRAAVRARTFGTGPAGFFESEGDGISVLQADGGQSFDTPTASVFVSRNFGASGYAGRFLGLEEGGDGVLRVDQVGSSSAAAFRVRTSDAAGDFAVYEVGSDNRIRFDRTGKGFFDGGTQTGGADLAESFDVEGPIVRYEPGDVLVISSASDRRVARSVEPYSMRVIGVYATKPGVLLSDQGIDAPSWGRVPVGVVGVIPTKVTAEGGSIGRGDILVTSSRSGHAMKADPVQAREGRIPSGAILGKALEPFEGPGTGVIEVMVNVK